MGSLHSVFRVYVKRRASVKIRDSAKTTYSSETEASVLGGEFLLKTALAMDGGLA